MTKKKFSESLSKKTIKQLNALGYIGEPTIDDAVRWLREKKGNHIMPCPYRLNQWELRVCYIEKANVHDGKLYLYTDDKIFPSHDAAAVEGISFISQMLYDARRLLVEHWDDKEFIEKCEREAREMGLIE